MDFDDLEIFYLRRKLYDEVNQVCQGWGPEAKDFNMIKDKILAHIAYKIWEKQGKPQNNDVNIWLKAEQTWNFIRYMWD